MGDGLHLLCVQGNSYRVSDQLAQRRANQARILVFLFKGEKKKEVQLPLLLEVILISGLDFLKSKEKHTV